MLVRGAVGPGQLLPPRRQQQRQQGSAKVRVARPARSAKKQPQSLTQTDYKALWNQQASSSPTVAVPEHDNARPASREELEDTMWRGKRRQQQQQQQQQLEQQQQQQQDEEDYDEGEITLTSYCRGFGEESEGTTGF